MRTKAMVVAAACALVGLGACRDAGEGEVVVKTPTVDVDAGVQKDTIQTPTVDVGTTKDTLVVTRPTIDVDGPNNKTPDDNKIGTNTKRP